MQLSDVKKAISTKQTVSYNGIDYYVSAVIMRIHHDKLEWYYQLELHDLKANAITIADMDKVVEKPPQNATQDNKM